MSSIQVSFNVSRHLNSIIVRNIFVLLLSLCLTFASTSDKTVRFPEDVIVFPKEDNLEGQNKQMRSNEEYRQTEHFRHNPEFHKLHPALPPMPSERSSQSHVQTAHNPKFHQRHDFRKLLSEDVEYKNESINKIPLDFIQNINEFSNVSEILQNFIEGGETDLGSTILEDRFSSGERNGAITPKPAGCKPELRTVNLVTSEDASVLFIPQCTRLERCGGCCSHHLLKCQPTEVEPVNFSVMKTKYVGGTKLKYLGKEIVLMERHTKCKCDCKVKAEDCYPYQQYRKSECRCVCTNTDEEKKCYRKNQTKLWDPNLCSCVCREVKQCSSGFEFDPIECKCAATPARNRYSDVQPRADYPFDYEE